MAQGSKYGDSDRRQAAVVYAVEGSFSAVERKTGVPRQTIQDWAKTEWWDQLCSEVRQETEGLILAGNEKIIRQAQDELLDRIENGDFQLVRTGGDYETRRVPMRGKDLAVVAAIGQDKRRLSLNLPTSIHGNQGSKEHLQRLAEQFAELARAYQEKQAKVVSVQDTGGESERS